MKKLQIIKNSRERVPESEYIGEFNVLAEQEANFKINISTGGHSILADEPNPIGDNSGPTPVDLLLAGYAGCFEMSWLALCSLSNVKVEEIKVKISAKIDRRDSIGGPNDPPRRLQSLQITSIIKTAESEAKLSRVLAKVIRGCPVGGSIHPDIDREYLLQIIPNS